MGRVTGSVAGQAPDSAHAPDVRPASRARGSARPYADRTVLLTLGALTALAAMLRFATLDVQSFWFDEALTVGLTHGSLHDMMVGIRAHEANPPLYYTLARFWSRVFGDGEVGLRSLSALAGTLTVPAAYGAARALVDRRTGMGVAVLAAFSPALVWYSQEARAYALVVFLCAVSLWFFARARSGGRPADYAGWAVASVLALWTHYFAAFVLLPEAVLLLATAERRRSALLAAGAVAAGAAVVAPLALEERTNGGGQWISGVAFLGRLVNLPYFFAGGFGHHWYGPLWVLVAAGAFVVALLGALRDRTGWRRDGAFVALAVGAVAFGLPVAAKAAGVDYILERNLLPSWLPLAIFVVAGATRLLPARVASAALAVVVVVYVAVNVDIVSSPGLQRDDWRSAAKALGPTVDGTVVAVAPGWQSVALRVYRSGLKPMRAPHRVSQLVSVRYTGPVPFNQAVQKLVPGPPFRRVRRVTIQRFTLTWYRSDHPRAVEPRALEGPGPNRAWPYVEAARP